MRTLVLGAGRYQRIEGAVHHDAIAFPGIDFIFNLDNAWSHHLKGQEFDQVICTHVVEHLKDLIHFMNEAHEVVEREGQLIIETPNAGVNPDLEFCDPTHVRCYRPGTFINYFTAAGRSNFNYTKKVWVIWEITTFKLEVEDDMIRVVLTPVK